MGGGHVKISIFGAFFQAVTCVREVLLAGPISSGVDIVPIRSEKDSYNLFPVEGVLIQ